MLKHEFIRFILVGVLNTIFGYSIYALFIFIGFNFVIASFFATIIGILFNFQTIGRLVFQAHDNRLIFRFFMVYGIVFLFGIIFIWLLKLIGLNNYIAGLITLFPNAIISYLLNKFYVYRRRV